MRGRPVRADLEENITVSRGLAPQRHRGTRSQRLGKGTQRLKGPLHSKELVKSHMVTHWVPQETYQSYSSLYPQHPVPPKCSTNVE